MKTFRKWIEEISPSWLLGEVGVRLQNSVSLTVDLLTETLLEAVYARFLYSSDFPDDALKHIGSERLMPRYGPESARTYKARLKKAWTSWTFAGTRQAVIEQLEASGITEAELYENWQWNWDGDVDDWSRFWVVLRGHPFGGVYWGDPNYGGFTWGSTMTVADAEYALRRVVRQWKAGHTRAVYIIVVFDQAAWDAAMPPNGNWDDPANWPPGAAFIPG